MGELLLQPVAWLLDGPAGTVMAGPWGAPAAGAASLVAVAAGAKAGAAYDRLSVSARHGLVTAAFLVAVYAPHQTGARR